MKKTTIAALVLAAALPLTGQSPQELTALLPPLEGWEISATEVFTPDNLFDRINGAAPLYIENNFEEMTTLDYTRGEDYITVQAYRHATPQDAYGMYASERSDDGLEFLPIGAEAQGDASNLFFHAGSLYVKMWASGDDFTEELRQTAGAFAENIAPQAALPPLFGVFPEEGKVPRSERYTTRNYLGHDFLNEVYSVEYLRDGNRYQFFVMDAGTPEERLARVERYNAFTRQGRMVEGSLAFEDRYNGYIPAFAVGPYLIGIFSESGENYPGAGRILGMIHEKLKEIKP